MGLRRVIRLNAGAEANGYQTGAHREEGSCQDRNKHEDDTKKDQKGLPAPDEAVVWELVLIKM
jgi:hypothetical protein